MKFYFPRLLALSCYFLAAPSPLIAQPLNSALKLLQPNATQTAETQEALEARLAQWLKDARAALNEPDADTALPTGIDASAFSDYRRDLELTAQAIVKHQKQLREIPEARKQLDAARATDTAWTRFPEKPPYSVLMLDELADQQDVLAERLASYRSSLDLSNRSLDEIRDEAKSVEVSSRQLQAQAAETPADDAAMKWRLRADRAKSRKLGARAGSLQASISLLQDQLETVTSQLALVKRQLVIVSKAAVFRDEDLDKIKKTASDRKAALDKEILDTSKLQRDATISMGKLQAALDALNKPTLEIPEPEKTPEFALAAIKLEAEATRGDALQAILENLRILNQLEAAPVDYFRHRKTLSEASEKAAREMALQALQASERQLQAQKVVLTNELAGVSADIRSQESRAASVPAEDPRTTPLSGLRKALWDKQASMQRVSQVVSNQQHMLSRWLVELNEKPVKKTAKERFNDFLSQSWSGIKNLWRFEVFQYDNTQIVGGVATSVPGSVSLGKCLSGLLFFGISYLVCYRLNRRLRQAITRHGHITEAQTKTLSNWFMLVVGVLLALMTLHFLKIPLTIFAFFGGALAIGLGFGTQTLIKNFISGIIVLFERKIRVGDIVDIGGVSGSITEINTRSSVLRSGDGKETLVPNSLFLENRVTNLTLSNRKVRRLLKVRAPLYAVPHEVDAVLKKCVEQHRLILKDPAPIVTFEDFADGANVFGIYYWTEFNDKTNADVVASDLRFMITKQLADTGLSFPAVKPRLEAELKSSPLDDE